MTGRHGADDVLARRRPRRARRDHRARSDGLVVAEHGARLPRRPRRGDGWHGTMNYAGSLPPGVDLAARRRAFRPSPRTGSSELPDRRPAASRRGDRRGDARASVPASRGTRRSTRGSLLDSHDTARFRTVAGSRERQLVGVGLQMTTPGVPMVFAGDELGLEGDWGEDARRTMPWSPPRDLGHGRCSTRYRSLDRAAPRSRALARGGMRYAHVSADAIAYLREARDEAAPLPRGAGGARARSPAARPVRRQELETLVGRGRSASTASASSCRPAGRLCTSGEIVTDEGGLDVAEVQLKEVDKIYEGGVHAVQDLSHRHRGRRVPRPRRALGLRQDDGAADGRRARVRSPTGRSRSATGS